MALKKLSDEILEQTMKLGEFPEEIRLSAERVVVFMSQDWCPQWTEMEAWLDEFSNQATIYYSLYNLHPWFASIMEFKETRFGNLEVPYLRYYFRGKLIVATNWLPRGTFAAMLQREKPFKLAG